MTNNEHDDRALTAEELKSVTALLEEALRILRAHPQLFTPKSFPVALIGANVAVMATRLAARKVAVDDALLDIAPKLFAMIAQSTRDRSIRSRLHWLRVGWIEGHVGVTRRAVAFARRAGVVGVLDGDGAIEGMKVHTTCPRCGALAERSLVAPTPCSCGFKFANLEKEAGDAGS
jgi:hypothetical protein